MSFLHYLDVFKRNPTLMIKGKDSISITETIVFSIIFYIAALAILIYNFLDAYLENKPIVQESEQIRNLTSYEVIETSKLKFGLITNNIKYGNFGISLEALQIKDPRILGMPLVNMNTNTKANFFPQFQVQQNINSKPSIECPYLKDYNSFLTGNTICTEYFEKTTTIGGSTFSGEATFQQIMEMKIDFCDFYNIADQKSFNRSSIEKYIKNDPSQDAYYNFLKTGDIQDIPSNYPLTPVMYMANKTNMNKLYAGFKTNFQLEDPEYQSCNRTVKKYEKLIIATVTSTDLLDPDKYEGYYEFLQTKRYEFNPYKNTLSITIILKKVILKTHRGLFIGFGRTDEVTIYEQEVIFTEKPKLEENNDYVSNIEYVLDDRVKIVDRSYNKIDQILAQSFSIIDVILLFLTFISNYLTENQIEYEIINRLCYTDNAENFLNTNKKGNLSFNQNNLKKERTENDQNQNFELSKINDSDKTKSKDNKVDNNLIENFNSEKKVLDENENIDNNFKETMKNKENNSKNVIRLNESVGQGKNLPFTSSLNLILQKSTLKLFDDKKEKQNYNEENDVSSQDKKFFKYRSGIKEKCLDLVSFCSNNELAAKNADVKGYLVRKIVDQIDLINIIAKQNQFFKMFELFALDKFREEYSESSDAIFDDYFDKLDVMMKMKKVNLYA